MIAQEMLALYRGEGHVRIGSVATDCFFVRSHIRDAAAIYMILERSYSECGNLKLSSERFVLIGSGIVLDVK